MASLSSQLEDLRFSKEDIIIIVMGGSSSGKSTFVNLFARTGVTAGHYGSATTISKVYECSSSSISRFFLIDTPPFEPTSTRPYNDIGISDTTLLMGDLAELSRWLIACGGGIAGIIYLHRIDREKGSATMIGSMRHFRALCGDNGLSSVVMATTFWKREKRGIAAQREAEICQTSAIWGALLDLGSVYHRHSGTTASGDSMLRYAARLDTKMSLNALSRRQLADEILWHSQIRNAPLLNLLNDNVYGRKSDKSSSTFAFRRSRNDDMPVLIMTKPELELERSALVKARKVLLKKPSLAALMMGHHIGFGSKQQIGMTDFTLYRFHNHDAKTIIELVSVPEARSGGRLLADIAFFLSHALHQSLRVCGTIQVVAVPRSQLYWADPMVRWPEVFASDGVERRQLLVFTRMRKPSCIDKGVRKERQHLWQSMPKTPAEVQQLGNFSALAFAACQRYCRSLPSLLLLSTPKPGDWSISKQLQTIERTYLIFQEAPKIFSSELFFNVLFGYARKDLDVAGMVVARLGYLLQDNYPKFLMTLTALYAYIDSRRFENQKSKIKHKSRRKRSILRSALPHLKVRTDLYDGDDELFGDGDQFQPRRDELPRNATSNSEATFSDRSKVLLEKVIGEQLLWAPLKEPLRSCPQGYVRGSRLCQCGEVIHFDFPADVIPWRAMSHSSGTPRTASSSMAGQRCVTRSTNAATPSAQSPSNQSSATQSLSNGLRLQKPSLFGGASPQKATVQSQVQLNNLTSSGFSGYVHWCVDVSTASTRLAELDVRQLTEANFLPELLKQYAVLAGWRAKWSLRCCAGGKFRQFRRLHKSLPVVVCGKETFPSSSDYQYLCDEPSMDPAEKKAFLEGLLKHQLDQPEKNNHTPLLIRTPRKTPDRIPDKVSAEGFGFHAYTQISFRRMVHLLSGFTVLNVPGLVFFVYWLVTHHGDWQNAAVPLTATLAMDMLLVAYIQVLGVSK